MRESTVRHLFNEAGDRQRMREGLRQAAACRWRIALVMACYMIWMVAGCSGPSLALGSGSVGIVVPAWMGPLACMALASVVIAVWFKKTRKVPTSPSWMVALVSLMTLASVLHLVWALDLSLPSAVRDSLYLLSSVVMGVGCALFRVEIDRVFGWIGTQQTLYQGILSTTVASCGFIVLAVVGGVTGLANAPLFIVSLVLPSVGALLLQRVVKGFPKARYFGHGREVELPFPTKFVVTSCVQGVAAGVLFMGTFLLFGSDIEPALMELRYIDDAVLRSMGQILAAGLLLATLVFLRLDFNRLIYKVAFPFAAAGFVLFALMPQRMIIGSTVLAVAFCYLDLVLWSLGACLMKNMGLPATWIASCPGAALFCGAVVGGIVTFAFLGGRMVPDAALLASLVACFVLGTALLLSSGSNLKYGWGTVLPSDSSLAAGNLAGVVKFVATEREITQRESEVMLLLAEGKTRRVICEDLSVSPDTVKTHVRSIYRKLAVHSQQELVDYLAREREELSADGSEHALEG